MLYQRTEFYHTYRKLSLQLPDVQSVVYAPHRLALPISGLRRPTNPKSSLYIRAIYISQGDNVRTGTQAFHVS